MEETVSSALDAVKGAAEALNSVLPIQIAVIVLLLLFCFAGYKLLRGYSALIGLAVGAGIVGGGMLLLNMVEGLSVNTIFAAVLMVAAAILMALLCFRFYHVGIFFLSAAVGAGIGYVPGLFLIKYTQGGVIALIAVCALLFGVTGVLFVRPVGILATALCGFGAAYPILSLAGITQPLPIVGAGAVLTLLGILVQALTNRGAEARPWLGKQLLEDEEEDEEEPEEVLIVSENTTPKTVTVRQRVDDIDEVSDATQMIDVSKLTEQEQPKEKDDIDWISDSVAAHIGGIAPTAPEPTRTEVPRAAAETSDTGVWEVASSDFRTASAEEIPQTAGLENTAAVADDQTKIIPPTEPEAAPQEEPVTADDDDDMTLIPDTTPEEAPQEESVTADDDDDMTLIPDTKPEEAAEAVPEADDATKLVAPAAEPVAELEEAPAPTLVPEEEPAVTEEPPIASKKAKKQKEKKPAKEKPKKEKKPKKPRKKGSAKRIFPILLILAVLAVAALGIHYIEILLALAFLCYVLRYYRTTAFACAVLCVRRVLEIVLLVMQPEPLDWLNLGMMAVSALAFLILTAAALNVAGNAKRRGK